MSLINNTLEALDKRFSKISDKKLEETKKVSQYYQHISGKVTVTFLLKWFCVFMLLLMLMLIGKSIWPKEEKAILNEWKIKSPVLDSIPEIKKMKQSANILDNSVNQNVDNNNLEVLESIIMNIMADSHVLLSNEEEKPNISSKNKEDEKAVDLKNIPDSQNQINPNIEKVAIVSQSDIANKEYAQALEKAKSNITSMMRF